MIKVTKEEPEPVVQPPPKYRISSTEGQGQYVLTESEARQLYRELAKYFARE